MRFYGLMLACICMTRFCWAQTSTTTESHPFCTQDMYIPLSLNECFDVYDEDAFLFWLESNILKESWGRWEFWRGPNLKYIYFENLIKTYPFKGVEPRNVCSFLQSCYFVYQQTQSLYYMKNLLVDQYEDLEVLNEKVPNEPVLRIWLTNSFYNPYKIIEIRQGAEQWEGFVFTPDCPDAFYSCLELKMAPIMRNAEEWKQIEQQLNYNDILALPNQWEIPGYQHAHYDGDIMIVEYAGLEGYLTYAYHAPEEYPQFGACQKAAQTFAMMDNLW